MQVSLNGARVLVAEDNEVNLEVAKFHLENLGCTTISAANGAEALDLARGSAFDYVLMDCQMPVMDGFEALKHIRLLEVAANRQHTPVIAVTAADDLESQQECSSAGFDGFLSKPYSADQLKAALMRFAAPDAAAPATPNKAAAAIDANTLDVVDAATFTGFVNDFGIDSADTLLKPFVALLGETAARLDAACASNDIAALQKLSHKVAGASGTVGAMSLSRQARAIEGNCKHGSPVDGADIHKLKDMVRAAAIEFDRLLEPGAIKAFITSSKS